MARSQGCRRLCVGEGQAPPRSKPAVEGQACTFTTNEANGWLVPRPARLAGLGRTALWDARAQRWRNDAVRQWLDRLQAFRHAQLVN